MTVSVDVSPYYLTVDGVRERLAAARTTTMYWVVTECVTIE